MQWLVCGLGNIGSEYQGTRHNIGFEIIDSFLAKTLDTPIIFKEKFKAKFCQIEISDNKIVFAKPETYMNNSGIAVSEITKFYKIIPKHIIIIHDDLDLKFLDIRTKQGGGHAGHNGLRDIDNRLGTKNYHRIRIGIDHPRNTDLKSQDVADYVLRKFSFKEQEKLPEIIEQAIKKITALILV